MRKIVNIKNFILLMVISIFSIGMFSLSEQISPQEIIPYQYEDVEGSQGSQSIEQQSSKSNKANCGSNTPYDLELYVVDDANHTITHPSYGGALNDGSFHVFGQWSFNGTEPLGGSGYVDLNFSGTNYPARWIRVIIAHRSDYSYFRTELTGLEVGTYEMYYHIHHEDVNGNFDSNDHCQVNSDVEIGIYSFNLEDAPHHTEPYGITDPVITTITEPHTNQSDGVIEISGSWEFDDDPPVNYIRSNIGGWDTPNLNPDNKSFTFRKSGLAAGTYDITYQLFCLNLNGMSGGPTIPSNIIPYELTSQPYYLEVDGLSTPTVINETRPYPGQPSGEIEISGNWTYGEDDPVTKVEVYLDNSLDTTGTLSLATDSKSFTYTIPDLIAKTYDIYYIVHYKALDGTDSLEKQSGTNPYPLLPSKNYIAPHTPTKPVVATIKEPYPGLSEGEITVSGSWEYGGDNPIERVDVYLDGKLHGSPILSGNSKSFSAYLITGLLAGTYDIHYEVIYISYVGATGQELPSIHTDHPLVPSKDFSAPHTLIDPITTTTTIPNTDADDAAITIDGSWQYDGDNPIESVTLWVGSTEYRLTLVDLEPDHKSFIYSIPTISVGTYLVRYKVFFKDVDNSQILSKVTGNVEHIITPTNNYTPARDPIEPIVISTPSHPDPSLSDGKMTISGSWEYDNTDPIEYVEIFIKNTMHKKLELTDLEPDHKSFTYTTPSTVPAGTYDIHYDVYFKNPSATGNDNINSSTEIHTVNPTHVFHPVENLTKPVVTTVIAPQFPGQNTGTIEVKGSWHYDGADNPVTGVEVYLGGSLQTTGTPDLDLDHKSFTYEITNLKEGTYNIYYKVNYRNMIDTTDETTIPSDTTSHSLIASSDLSPAYDPIAPIVGVKTKPYPGASDGIIEVKGSWEFDGHDPIEYVDLDVNGAIIKIELNELDSGHKSFTKEVPTLSSGMQDIKYTVYYKNLDNSSGPFTQSLSTSYDLEPSHDFSAPHSPIITTTTIANPLPGDSTGAFRVSGSWQKVDVPIEHVDVYLDGNNVGTGNLSVDEKSFTYEITGLLKGTYEVHYVVYHKDLDDASGPTIISTPISHTVEEHTEIPHAVINNVETVEHIVDYRDGLISFDYQITNPDNVDIEKLEINLIDINNLANNQTTILDSKGSNWQEKLEFSVGKGEYQIEVVSTFITSQSVKQENVVIETFGGIVVTERILSPLTAIKTPDITVDTFSVSVYITDDWGMVIPQSMTVTTKINGEVVDFEDGLTLEYNFTMKYNEKDIESYEVIISLETYGDGPGQTEVWTGGDEWEEFTWHNGIEYSYGKILIPLLIVGSIGLLGTSIFTFYYFYRR